MVSVLQTGYIVLVFIIPFFLVLLGLMTHLVRFLSVC